MKILTEKIHPNYSITESMAFGLGLLDKTNDSRKETDVVLTHSSRALEPSTEKEVEIWMPQAKITTREIMARVEDSGKRFGDYGELNGLWLDRHPETSIVILPSMEEFERGCFFQNFGEKNLTPEALCIFNIMGGGFEMYFQAFNLDTEWDAFWGFLVTNK